MRSWTWVAHGSEHLNFMSMFFFSLCWMNQAKFLLHDCPNLTVNYEMYKIWFGYVTWLWEIRWNRNLLPLIFRGFLPCQDTNTVGTCLHLQRHWKWLFGTMIISNIWCQLHVYIAAYVFIYLCFCFKLNYFVHFRHPFIYSLLMLHNLCRHWIRVSYLINTTAYE